MKIIFNRQEIISAASPLMCAVSNKSTLKSIEGILIEAKVPDRCTLTTFDLEKGMRITVEAKVIEEGNYIINAQKFMQTMKVMEGEEVILSVDDKMQACILCDKSSHKMSALAGSDFPEVPNLSSEKGFIIDEATLKEMIAKITHAMAVNSERTVLNGCYFKVEDGNLYLVSCDSFKLAKCVRSGKVENKNPDGGDMRFSFIVPVRTVNELYRLLSDGEKEKVKIHVTRKNIILEIGEYIFFSRLVDGEYLDYERIILRNHKIDVEVGRNEFISALERAALVTDEKIAHSVQSHVKLEFSGDILKIYANSSNGSTYDELPISHGGEDIVIAFNNRYLIDSLRACEGDEVKLSLSSPHTSINIEPAEEKDGEENFFMLLPVRMRE